MERQEGHIGFLEAVLLTMTVLSVNVLLPFPSQMVQWGETAGWILVLFTAGWAALGVLAVGHLMAASPGRSLPEVVRDMTGPLAGPVLNLGLAALLVVDSAVVLRLFTESFIVAVLPRTPPSVLSLTALLVAVYAGFLGLEAIARAQMILWPILGLTFLSALLLSLPEARLDWLFPFWGPGSRALMATGFRNAGFLYEAVILAFYAYALRGPGEPGRAALTGLLIASLALAAMVAVYTGVFGAVPAARQPFPFFSLARLIYLGRFFERVEAIFVLFWVLAAIVRQAIILHAAAVTMSTTLRLPHYRPLLVPLAVLVFSLSLVPRDYVQTLALHTRLKQAAAVPAFLLPVALLAAAAWRRREATGVER